MKQITTSNGSYIFVEVPKEYTTFKLKNYHTAGIWLMETNSSLLNHWKVNIPKIKGWETLSFLCTTDTITEDIAKGIVEEIIVLGRAYICYQCYTSNHAAHHYDNALDSFKSLIEYYNLSPDINYAICKQN